MSYLTFEKLMYLAIFVILFVVDVNPTPLLLMFIIGELLEIKRIINKEK